MKLCRIILWSFLFLSFSFPALGEVLNTWQGQLQLSLADFFKRHSAVILMTDLNSSQTFIYGESKLAKKFFLPGSLMKLITAEAALTNSKHLNFEYHCTGQEKQMGQINYCWRSNGHGRLFFSKALAISCNLYFLKLAQHIKLNTWIQILAHYPSLENALLSKNKTTLQGDFEKLVLGESRQMLVSPQQIFDFWILYLKNFLKPEWKPIIDGLTQSTLNGTASALKIFHGEILGKTGTGDALKKAYSTNGWFIGAWPSSSPRYAFVIFVTQSHGYEAPIKAAIKLITTLKNFSQQP